MILSRLLRLESIISDKGIENSILIFSGDQDPVGEMGKGVTKVAKNFKNNGNEDLTFKLYEGGRHEMLNEINSEEVEEDIITWLKAKIPAPKHTNE